ncbi:MAG: hypothetical protein II313_05815 [Anaerotignum sp.]|nr:hypothetical protein [Anaerotignum sp.]
MKKAHLKKLFSVVMVLAMVLGTLAGCGGGSSAEEPKRPVNEIPSPMTYLGGEPFFEEENRYTFLYDTALTMFAAEDYADLLSNEYGMTLKVKETDEGYCIWYLENEEDPAVSVKLSCKDYDGVYELDFVFGENVVLIDAEEWSIPADEVPEEPAAEEPQITTPTLPDLFAFIGGNGAQMDQSSQEGEVGQEYGYRMEFEDGWIAANEYVELLKNDPRFQLSMQPRKAEDSETILYLQIEEYEFDYVGDKDITPATIRGDKVDGVYQFSDADVHIKIQKNGQKGTTSIVIWHSDDFDVKDLGDRASVAPAGASGSGGSSVPNSNTQSARKPCPYCDDGDCDKCGGDGYLHSLASDKEDRNCPALYCNNGRCSYCDGDGWYE